MTDAQTALNEAVAGEYAAIYAYGVLGPHLTGFARNLAVSAELAHRDLRDSLLERLASPPPPQANYAVPFPVTDYPSAIALAVHVEEKCAALWRAVTAASDANARQQPLDELTNAALRAAAFRRAGGAIPGTVAFPGM
jgi:Domain of unknown function (DUF4439)